MPFVNSVDGSITKGETKQLVIRGDDLDGKAIVLSSISVTLTFSDGTTVTKSISDATQSGGDYIFDLDFTVEGNVKIEISADDSSGRTEKITPEGDGSEVYVR